MRIRKNEDLTGQKFGRLLVINFDSKAKDGRLKWSCLCDCGKEFIAYGASLRSTDKKSCGCLEEERRNLCGKKYGRWTVISKIGPNKKYHCTDYLCECECGTKKRVASTKLKRKKSLSCGCFRIEDINRRAWKATIPNGGSAFNSLFRLYLNGAKKRNLTFGITKEEFKFFTKQSCNWCGIEPNQKHKPGGRVRSEAYVYNGIDRLNSQAGYLYANCVSACGQCNIAKMDYSESDFLTWVGKVYEQNKTKIIQMQSQTINAVAHDRGPS